MKVFIDALSRTKMLEGLNYTYWNECFTSKVVPHIIDTVKLDEFKSILSQIFPLLAECGIAFKAFELESPSSFQDYARQVCCGRNTAGKFFGLLADIIYYFIVIILRVKGNVFTLYF